MANKPEYHIGRSFGDLTIKEILSDKNKHGQTMCKCSCSCGKEVIAKVYSLVTGNTKSCGHTRGFPIDESIINYGRLTIKEFLPFLPKEPRLVIAECECGNIVKRRLMSLRAGGTTSCGCSANVNHNIFDSDSNSVMYWAGFIAADGCIMGNTLQITIHEKDIDLIESFKNICSPKISTIKPKRGPYAGVAFRSSKITDLFRSFGITERKSLTFTPKGECVSSADFWRGMVDGDGTLCWTKNRPALILYGSHSMLPCFSDWVLPITGFKYKVYKYKSIGAVRIYGKNAIKVASELYGKQPEYFLKRKYDMFISFLENKPKRNL